MGEGQPRLLDQVRDRIRRKHYSILTEQAYVDWIRRFVLHYIPHDHSSFPRVDASIRCVPTTYASVRTLMGRGPTMIQGVPTMIPRVRTMIPRVPTTIQTVPASSVGGFVRAEETEAGTVATVVQAGR